MRKGHFMGQIKSDIGFYVGDICYALSDKMYHEVWGDKYHFDDGCFEAMDSGFSFAVGSTANGDGCYVDNEGHEYPVDAGCIGIVPLELVAKEKAKDLGFISKGPGKAHYEINDGKFIFSVPSSEKGRMKHTLYIDTHDYYAEMEDDYDD